MIPSLPLFHRIAGQPVIVLGEGDAAQARRRLVERAGGSVIDDLQDGIEKGARLAFVAHADEAAARDDVARLRAAGLLVNAADRPDLCDFTMPAIVDRSPVVVAIGTDGASAGLAKALRLRLEALLPPSLGSLARKLGAARGALRKRLPDPTARRRALDAALEAGGTLDPLDGRSCDRAADWIGGIHAPQPGGSFEIRIAGPDPDDLTLRQARLLGSADIIAHEPGVPVAILDRARADAARLSLVAGGAPPQGDGLIVILRM